MNETTDTNSEIGQPIDPHPETVEQEDSSLIRALREADAEAGLGYVLNRQDIEHIAALLVMAYGQDDFDSEDELVASVELFLDSENAAPAMPAKAWQFVQAAAAAIRCAANTALEAALATDASVAHVTERLRGVTTIEEARALPMADLEKLATHFVPSITAEITTFRDEDGCVRTVVVQGGALAKA